MIEPAGSIAQILIDLLVAMGLPAAVVVTIGTGIAVAQWVAQLDDAGHAVEARAMATFRGSPRVVRAYALFVASHVIAASLSVGLLVQLFRNPLIVSMIGASVNDVLLKANAGVVLYFLIVDWWSLHRGDEVPAFLAAGVGFVGLNSFLIPVLRTSVITGDWGPLLPWFVVTAVWFRSLTWATYRASALARALQGC